MRQTYPLRQQPPDVAPSYQVIWVYMLSCFYQSDCSSDQRIHRHDHLLEPCRPTTRYIRQAGSPLASAPPLRAGPLAKTASAPAVPLLFVTKSNSINLAQSPPAVCMRWFRSSDTRSRCMASEHINPRTSGQVGNQHNDSRPSLCSVGS